MAKDSQISQEDFAKPERQSHVQQRIALLLVNILHFGPQRNVQFEIQEHKGRI